MAIISVIIRSSNGFKWGVHTTIARDTWVARTNLAARSVVTRQFSEFIIWYNWQLVNLHAVFLACCSSAVWQLGSSTTWQPGSFTFGILGSPTAIACELAGRQLGTLQLGSLAARQLGSLAALHLVY